MCKKHNLCCHTCLWFIKPSFMNNISVLWQLVFPRCSEMLFCATYCTRFAINSNNWNDTIFPAFFLFSVVQCNFFVSILTQRKVHKIKAFSCRRSRMPGCRRECLTANPSNTWRREWKRSMIFFWRGPNYQVGRSLFNNKPWFRSPCTVGGNWDKYNMIYCLKARMHSLFCLS